MVVGAEVVFVVGLAGVPFAADVTPELADGVGGSDVLALGGGVSRFFRN